MFSFVLGSCSSWSFAIHCTISNNCTRADWVKWHPPGEKQLVLRSKVLLCLLLEVTCPAHHSHHLFLSIFDLFQSNSLCCALTSLVRAAPRSFALVHLLLTISVCWPSVYRRTPEQYISSDVSKREMFSSRFWYVALVNIFSVHSAVAIGKSKPAPAVLRDVGAF